MIKKYFYKDVKRNFSIATIWINGGSKMDSNNKKGLNQILCSLLTRGCEGFDNLKLADYIETHGAELNHEVVEVYNNDKVATFEVNVLDKDKKYYKFKWQVEKYLGDGPLNDCWLTTAVSQPTPTGSSI